jgi:energy-coupling factor transport system ATP-binding protein
MLDPSGRKDILRTIEDLNKNNNMTIILITHYMEEAINADRIMVIDNGKAIIEGSPRRVFKEVATMKKIGLDVPQMTELAYELRQSGINVKDDILSIDEMVNALCQLK